MKTMTLEENTKLYYIRCRYGSSKWGSKKTFVRVGKFRNNMLVGSEMYCSNKYTSLFFKSIEECDKFRKLYNCDDMISELNVKDDSIMLLKEYEYKNIKCYVCRKRLNSI